MQDYRDRMRRCRNSHRAKVEKLALVLPWILLLVKYTHSITGSLACSAGGCRCGKIHADEKLEGFTGSIVE